MQHSPEMESFHAPEEPTQVPEVLESPEQEAPTALTEQERKEHTRLIHTMRLVADHQHQTPEEIENHRGTLERFLDEMHAQEDLLARSLASPETFTSTFYTLAGLADNKFAFSEPVGAAASEFATNFIEYHIERIERVVQEKATNEDDQWPYDDAGAALRAIASLVEAGWKYASPDHPNLFDRFELGKTVLERNFGIIEQAIRDDAPHAYIDDDASKITNYAIPLTSMFQHCSRDTRMGIARLAAEISTAQDKKYGASHLNHIAHFIVDRLSLHTDGLRPDVPRDVFIHDVLEAYGLPPNKIFAAWQQSTHANPDAFTKRVWRNITTMGSVEHYSEDGAIETLHKEFGIRNFGRYPSELLEDQYKRREETDLSYGLVINGLDDYNGALYRNRHIYDYIVARLRASDKPWGLRVVEVENKREAGRLALSFSEKYQPATFGIIGGHGTGADIELGTKGEKGDMRAFNIEDIAEPGFGRAARMLFEDGAVIILNSCFGGIPAGIGQEASKELPFTIMGSDQSIHLKSIDVDVDAGNIEIYPHYLSNKKDAPTWTYRNGRAVAEEKSP